MPFIDVAVQSLGDPHVYTEDLEDQRREIIALSGIPSSYLGWPEPMELREQLVHVNVSLATEISNIQENFNENIEKILDRIFYLCECKYKPSTYLKINLFPPVVLMLQLIESTLTSTSNIINIFRDIPNFSISPMVLLQKYVPYIDWTDMVSQGEQVKIKKSIETAVNPNAANSPPQQPGGF